jgi:hypothetical protein
VPKIVLVCTEFKEAKEYIKYRVNVISNVANKPLGRKWQIGLNDCFDADPLIITGSDDILARGFIARACELIEEGYDFIGLQQFWQHNQETAYLCNYKATQPIGGGRIYSKRMLEHLNYRLFDVNKDRHLDDFAMRAIRNSKMRIKIVHDIEREGLEIHAIKGNWSMMNPFTLQHPNISLVKHRKSEYI